MKEFQNRILSLLGNPADLVIRDIAPEKCSVMFIKNMTDRKYISDGIIIPLVSISSFDSFEGDFENIVGSASVTTTDDFQTLISCLLSGSVIIAIKNSRLYTAYCGADSFVGRGVSEPTSDVTVRGPKAGFTENGENNISQLRKIIRTDKFRVESLSLGKTTKTTVFICYVEGRADENALKEIKKRLKDFTGEYIIDSANIETLLDKKKVKLLSRHG